MKTTRIRMYASFGFFLCLFFLELQLWLLQPALLTNGAALSESLSNKILRLHILAEDDSAQAQEIKLLVRDRILSELSPLPSDVTTKAEAMDYLEQQLPALQAVVDEFLLELGCAYQSSITLGNRFFPIKDYGDYRFPAGNYDALCIMLGKGEGQNWWCLAFPRFCFVAGNSEISPDGEKDELKMLLTDEEYEAILKQEPKTKLESRLWNWLRKLIQQL